MDGDPTPALTGRRRTRPTSPGCRNPQQPEPGRAPLISAKPAVQSNRATSHLGAIRPGLIRAGLCHNAALTQPRLRLARLRARAAPVCAPGVRPGVRRRVEPDWASLARELKWPGVNLTVL